MDRKTAGRFLAIVCILITLTTGLMKALFPAVYDLIGSFCLVLVGLSMLAVGMIYCVIPYVRFPFNSRKYIYKEIVHLLSIICSSLCLTFNSFSLFDSQFLTSHKLIRH